MTWEVAIFWVAVLSVAATLAYGETEGGRQRRSRAIRQKSGEERLRRAWEDLALRYDLVVSFEWAIIEYREPNRGWQYVNAALVFRITNNGNSAVHNVHCEIRLDQQRLETDDTHRKNRGFYAPYIIERFTRVANGQVTLSWLMSTWNPYVVVRMESKLNVYAPEPPPAPVAVRTADLPAGYNIEP